MRCTAPIMTAILAFQISSHAAAVSPPLELERTQIVEMRRDVAAMRSTLQTCRSQIELFKFKHKENAPDFRRHGWKQLIEEQFLVAAPINPLVPAEVGDRVVVITGKGLEGDHVPASKAGWVWNETDEVLYPAGGTIAEIQERVDNLVPKTRRDDSLPLEEYARLGAPAHDRVWHGPDMKRMALVLAKVGQRNPAHLPRFGSERSGEMFTRLCDPQNLKFFGDGRMPIQQRAQSAMEYHESLGSILRMYSVAAQHDAIDSRDLIELCGHALSASVAMIELTEEHLLTLDRNDPTYAVRMEGNRKAQIGLAMMAAGAVEALKDSYYFRVSDRTRLLEFIHETLPSFMPHLPEATRVEIVRDLQQMSTTGETDRLSKGVAALVHKLEKSVVSGQR